MTRQEAIDAAPVGRGVYWTSFVAGMLLSPVFLGLAVFSARKSVGLAVVVVLIAVTTAVMAAQAAERLFYSVRAAERTASISDKQRLWMRRARTFLLLSYAVMGAAWIGMFIVTGPMHGVFIYLQVLWMVPYILLNILADVQGKQVGAMRLSLKLGNGIPQREMGPLRSKHWGDRG
ncbi:MAG: hypothetical protein WB439_11535 [Acidobacteriaceae bacterium]